MLPPIFVADTKIIYGNNFIAPLRSKEKWTPNKNVPYSKYIYRGLVKNDINTSIKQPTKKLKSNVTHTEHIATEELAKRKTS